MTVQSQSDLFGLKATATFSPCGKYRYDLARRLGERWVSPVYCVFVMLNPSKADAFTPDPTFTACCDFAERLSCNWVRLVNCYAWKATDPKEMFRAARGGADIIGAENDKYIQEAVWGVDVVICGWGKHASPERAAHVLGLIREAGAAPRALAVNKDGSPKHPLYIKRDTVPRLYDLRGAA